VREVLLLRRNFGIWINPRYLYRYRRDICFLIAIIFARGYMEEMFSDLEQALRRIRDFGLLNSLILAAAKIARRNPDE